EVCLANLNHAVRVQPVGSWFQIDVDAGRAGLSANREGAGEMGVVVFDQHLLGGKPELRVGPRLSTWDEVPCSRRFPVPASDSGRWLARDPSDAEAATAQ